MLTDDEALVIAQEHYLAIEGHAMGAQGPLPWVIDAIKAAAELEPKPPEAERVAVVAWIHTYRRKGGGGGYDEAEVGDWHDEAWRHPDPRDGYEWKSRAPLIVARLGGTPKQPTERSVGRMGDMAPPGKTHMTVALDCDNDACVQIWDQETGEGQLAGIEFCTTFGGGRSPRTRAALVALMLAMEADNAETPAKRWPPTQGAG